MATSYATSGRGKDFCAPPSSIVDCIKGCREGLCHTSPLRNHPAIVLSGNAEAVWSHELRSNIPRQSHKLR